MYSFLAKPLDWLTIQLASRALKKHALTPCAPAPPIQIEAVLDQRPVSAPADLHLDAEGTFRFTSAVLTGAAENNLVVGRLMRAPGARLSNPTLILLHGWNAELCYARMFPWLASLLNAAQVNVALMELPYHMHRRPASGPVRDFISSDLESMLQATQQAVADIRRLCRWLEGQGTKAIGLWGFSLGAWLAGLTLPLEPQLSCAVLTTPIVMIDRAVAELAFCAPIRAGLAERELSLNSLNLSAVRPAIPADRILLVESRHDLFAPAETVEELWKAWGKTEIWRLAHGHISILMSSALSKRTVRWISWRLGG